MSKVFQLSLIVLSQFLIAENLFADPCKELKPTDRCFIDEDKSESCVVSSGDNVIIGSSGDDVIFGGPGSDKVMAGGGNDVVCGGGGDDIIFGGEGDDYLDGGDGSNVVYGEQGNDVCLRGSVAGNCEKTKTEDLKSCASILGKWHWFDNGMVEFTKDNKVQWYEPMTGRKGHNATWVCDIQNGEVTIPWSNGFTDKMRVIASGRSLQGRNNIGMTIWAQRIPE